MSTSKYRQNENTSSHSSGERVVVYHQESKDSIVLNPTGTLIWRSLEEAKTKTEIIDEMKAAYSEVSEADLERDLELYLQELLANKLILVAT